MIKEDIIKELDKQNRKLGEELSLTKDKLDKTLFEKEHYKKLYSVVKKQKVDVFEYIKNNWYSKNTRDINEFVIGDWRIDILRMLGEIDE